MIWNLPFTIYYSKCSLLDIFSLINTLWRKTKMPHWTSKLQYWPNKRTINLEKILRGQENFNKSRIFWTWISHFKSVVIVTPSSLMHVTEILGGAGFVKDGGHFKKSSAITNDLLALTFTFHKEASCVTSSSNVIIELLIFRRQTSSADRSSTYFHLRRTINNFACCLCSYF